MNEKYWVKLYFYNTTLKGDDLTVTKEASK